MNPLIIQQRALDDALVTPDNCAIIGKSFLANADVPEIYMHQFWFTITKIKDSSSYKFKLDNKCFKVGIVAFIKELGYQGELKSITEMHIDHMSQPWRTFASIINRCLSGKVTTFDQLRLSRAQILYGMFYKKNVDFIELIWEDFMYQIENRQSTVARRSNMPYPRFTKAIIQHFIFKDKTISMRNNLFMHEVKNDSVLCNTPKSG
ncbi:hypothetical protein Tco_0071023 [Tanacetum coccineum]